MGQEEKVCVVSNLRKFRFYFDGWWDSVLLVRTSGRLSLVWVLLPHCCLEAMLPGRSCHFATLAVTGGVRDGFCFAGDHRLHLTAPHLVFPLSRLPCF